MQVSVSTTSPYSDSDNYPVSVAELKSHMRIDGTDEDTLIGIYIAAAAEILEGYLRRALIEQTRVVRIDQLSGDDLDFTTIFGSDAGIYLSGIPVSSITTIKFYDEDGTATTVSSSEYYLDSRLGRVHLIDGYTWPTSQRKIDAVEVTYTCGYTDTPASLSPVLRLAVMQLAGYLYEHRIAECDLPEGICKLVSKYRLIRVGVPYIGIDFNKINLSSGSIGGY